MPRLAIIDPKTATGRIGEIFAGPLKGKELNIFKGMANSPAALGAYLAITGELNKGLLSAIERETIALATAQFNGCEYCTAAHTALGKKAGLSDEQTVAIRRGEPADPRIAALVRFTTAMLRTKGAVSDAILAAVRGAGFTDGQIAEIAANVAANVYTNYFNNTNKTVVDFPAPPQV